MIKYVPRMTDVVLEEIPERVTLAVEISNCQGSCEGCHSPFLKDDVGEELSFAAIDKLIGDNFGINCFLLLGEGNDPGALASVAGYLRSAHPGLETAIYSGRAEVEDWIYDIFDFVKTGPYVRSLGPLNARTTNQRLYYHRKDITEKFWH